VRLSPVVVSELLSNPLLPSAARRLIEMMPRLDLHDGYWIRAGILRAQFKALRRKANLADVLIAQSCIDHDIPLITYDRDFRHFRDAGLILI
jgi:predicted nucleic acid-binding protein